MNYHIIYINSLTPPVGDMWTECEPWGTAPNDMTDRDKLLGMLTKRFSEFLPKDEVLEVVARISVQLPQGPVTGTLMVIRHNTDNNTRI